MNANSHDDELSRRLGAEGRRGLRWMDALLTAGGTASVAMAWAVTTDAYHTVLFAGFGLALFAGAAVLLGRSVIG